MIIKYAYNDQACALFKIFIVASQYIGILQV